MTVVQKTFVTGTQVDAAWLNRVQEVKQGLAFNCGLSIAAGTLTLTAGAGNDAACIAIAGKMRVQESNLTITFTGGDSNGQYYIWAIAQTDDTSPAFTLSKTLGAGPPAATYYRELGRVQWTSPNLSALVQTAGYVKHGPQHTTTGNDPLPASSVDYTQLVAGQRWEPGDLKMAAQSTPMTGWLLCDGSAVSRTGANAALFAAISTTYGIGNGTTTFNLPDFRGRIPIGSGTGTGGGASGSTNTNPTGGSALTTRNMGAWVGEETHALSTGELAVHAHNITDPGHTHTIPNHTHGLPVQVAQFGGGTAGFQAGGLGPAPFTSGAAATTTNTDGGGGATSGASAAATVTNNQGSGTAHNNIQPQLCVAFFIKQ